MPGITEAFFRSPKLGEHTDDLAPGLILVVRPSKTGRVRKSWILRAVIDGKRRKIGLGFCGLAEARRRAAEARQAIREGNDPGHRAKARQRASLRASEAVRGMTFAEAAAQWLPRAPKLRNPKSEQIRTRALDHHLTPIRDKALTAITPADLVAILAALKPETAMRVYGAAKAVFEFGAVLLEPEDVNIRLPTDLPKLRALGWSPRSRRSQQPMPALDWRRAPELLAELERREEPIAGLLAFILATASRCGAARAAKRRNLDLKAKTWVVPVADLKDAAFRSGALIVPLNAVALSVIPQGDREYLFVDERVGRSRIRPSSISSASCVGAIRTGPIRRPDARSPLTACARCSAPGPQRPGRIGNWSSLRWATPSIGLSKAPTSETLCMSCAPN